MQLVFPFRELHKVAVQGIVRRVNRHHWCDVARLAERLLDGTALLIIRTAGTVF